MKTNWWNFKTKLLLMFAIIVVVPLVTVGFLVSQNTTEGIDQQTKSAINGLVQSLDRETADKIATSEKVVETLAQLPVMRSNDYAAQKAIFAAVLKDNPQLISLYTAYNGQKGLPSLMPEAALPEGFDATQRPWYNKAMQNEGVQLTEVYIDTSTKSPIVTVVKALKDNQGQKIGVIGADLNLDSLSEMVAKFNLGKEGYAYILDQNGIALAHPNKELVKEQTNLAEMLPFSKKALNGEQGFETYTFEGIEKIAGFKRIDRFGWGIFVQQPTSEAFSAVNKIYSNMVWTTLIAIIIAMVVGFVFSQAVSNKVRSVANVAAQMAKGDLTGRVEVSGNDELGVLAHSFNEMIANVRELLERVTGTAALVNESSQELTATAQEAAATTEDIAKGIDETIRVVEDGARIQSSSVDAAQIAMRELSQAVNQIAQGAQEQAENVNRGAEMVSGVATGIQEINQRMLVVDEAAKLNKAKAEEGGQIVAETIVDIEEIKKVVFEAADAIRELGNNSKQIGEIVEVIDDIAEQTNLLALNAAIEAARAGEHGKGFAVVADEVRKLAERSGKSTQEIRQLIQTIQKTTVQAVNSIEVGTDQVEKGSAKAQTAGKALQDIVAEARRSEEEIQVITRSIVEIRQQSEAVVQAIDNMAAITEENTASTEEMAAGSDNVLHTIENIAQATTDSANAVRGVSNSSGELRAVTDQVAVAASGLASYAQGLQELVSKFKL